MSTKPDNQDKIRKAAEAQLARTRLAQVATGNPEELLHELQVHQIELEMQNEELRRSHLALEESRDLYVDLFEFAPSGYITLGREAVISEINLTGCKLLGAERSKLVNRHFSRFIAVHDRDYWHRQFMDMMLKEANQKQVLDLAMMRADGSIFYAHCDCTRKEKVGSQFIFRISFSDVT